MSSGATQASQRVNLEVILEEVKVLQLLIETLSTPAKAAQMHFAPSEDTLVLLNNI